MILLTGATGFLGRYLARELLDGGAELRLLARDPKSAALDEFRKRAEIVEGDLLDVSALEAATKGARKIVHAAAVVSFAKKRAAEMRRVNVGGTANVVNVALEAGVEKLLLVSSVAALGRSAEGQTLDETARWKESRFNTRYGRSKYLAELEVARGVAEGLPAVILNPCVILGAGDWARGTPKMFSRIDQGFGYYPAGTNAFVSAADVARTVVLALDSDYAKGERFVLAAEHWSYKDLFSEVARLLGKPAPKRRIPPGLARLAGALNERFAAVAGTEPVITRETARTSGASFFYENRKFLETFPQFSYTPVKQTLAESAAAFRAAC